MSNFLGLPFNSWVKAQIDVRQKALGQRSNIDPKYLQSYTTKTPFLRLASSVDVTKTGPKDVELKKSVYKQLEKIDGLDANDFAGNKLSRNLILQGGVVNAPQGDLTKDTAFSGLQKGLNDGSSLFNGAYGWGGIKERGYVPMPGITDADITYYNNGALSKTIINVKCFSKAQFQLLDVLYLRPGYTLLLEFGWSQYLNNDSELKSMDQFYTTPMRSLLNGGGSQYDLYEDIANEREKHFGNYDAVYGKITKFNWQFNPDGSYDCQIQLTAVGDVIESLKININSPGAESTSEETEDDDDSGFFSWFTSDDSEDEDQAPLVANKNKSMLHREMYDIHNAVQGLVAKDNSSKSPPKFFNYIKRVQDESGATSAASSKRFKKAIFVVPVKAGDDDQSESPQVYMKYGALMAFIQSKLLLYSKTPKSTPIVSFDMNFDDLDDDDNVVLTFPGQFSANPQVCLIPYTNCANPDGDNLILPSSQLNDVLSEIKDTFLYKDSIYLMRLANIMVNIKYIESTLTSLLPTEGEGDVSLISYLQSLNKGIIEALGNINKWDCRLSQEGGRIQFIEDIPQRFGTFPSEETFTRFNVFGVKPGIEGSFIRNINLTADLSNDFATMISIGAQADSNQISGNATSFSNYNAGLKDRIIPEKLSSPSAKKEEDTPTPSEQLIENFLTNIFDSNSNKSEAKLLETVYGKADDKPSFISENVNTLTAFNDTHAELLLGILCSQPQEGDQILQSPFFLPFNLSLEMDGISGIKLFQKFLMTNDILPPSYQDDNVDLQVTGVNQKIDSGGWITKLDTLSTPANKAPGSPSRPAEMTSSQAQQQTTTTSTPLPPTTVAPDTPPENPEDPTRREAMKSSYDAVFDRDGEVSGMCAQWTYNLALNYVKYLNGKSLSGNKLRAGGNANNNNEYYKNLTAQGYTKTISTGLSKLNLIAKINSTVWGYGDVVAYYANDYSGTGSDTHYKYGHTQIYVGDINTSGWSTSKKTNYNTSFPYNSRLSFNWNLLVFRAPETAG